jgi:hypothetical protein
MMLSQSCYSLGGPPETCVPLLLLKMQMLHGYKTAACSPANLLYPNKCSRRSRCLEQAHRQHLQMIHHTFDQHRQLFVPMLMPADPEEVQLTAR